MSVQGKNSTSINDDTILKIKVEKTKAKSSFTRAKNQLLSLLDEEDLPSRRQVKVGRSKLDVAQENVIELLGKLSELYVTGNDNKNIEKTEQEMESIENDYSKVQSRTQEYLDSRKDDISSHTSVRSEQVKLKRVEEWRSHNVENVFAKENVFAEENVIPEEKVFPEETDMPRPEAIGLDLGKQLKRVAIPVFSGNKKQYVSWKAAFMACIDMAPATKAYKLLQLRQYLTGEALRVIENLGHSAMAYDAALERLERKFGGQRRQVAMYLEEIESFRPIREGMAKDIEKFADLLDVAVINLKEVGRHDELRNGSLYYKMQGKLTESMLARYHRWIYEGHQAESMETLREWVLQESEFYTIAYETIHGFNTSLSANQKQKDQRRDKPRTFFGDKQTSKETDVGQSKTRLCIICDQRHGVWKCWKFERASIPDRWDLAKQFKLCFRCLSDEHMGKFCPKKWNCGVGGCRGLHHRLLHSENYNRQTVEEKQTNPKVVVGAESQNENTGQREVNVEMPSTTMVTQQSSSLQFTALRVIPVYLENGKRGVVVNALLDDASTKTYLNADVAAELGLHGDLQPFSVNVINGQVESFDTMPVKFKLKSINGNSSTEVTALTTTNVTGDLQVVDWNKYANKWQHLRGIKFPDVGRKPTVDILIGLDYPGLHYSYKEIRGRPGEPMARLTPLGWTCVGNPDGNVCNLDRSHFAQTYFIKEHFEPLEALNMTLRQFWEIEEINSDANKLLIRPEEKIAMEKVKGSLKYNMKNQQYEVAIPWKDNLDEIPDNYKMAVQRLENTEKRLLKNPQLAKSYSDIIDQYLQKGYIKKAMTTHNSNEKKWYLPHFAVLRPDKMTTKVRIVFDASAKCDGISLNDMIYPGPKLQRDLVDVLLRFRKYPVAVICDITEMYLRIKLNPADRPFHRFLWRGLNQNKEPDEYEFDRVVFGVNASPFLAQYVSQQHAETYANEFPIAAETVLKSTYMDDSMDSVVNAEQGIELFQQLSQLWEKAGMHARKWLSNSPEVLQQIPTDDQANDVDLDNGMLPSIKTLGLLWKSQNDIFSFKIDSIEPDAALTKRKFLQKIATIFDPLGFLAPFIIRAKILMQEIWAAGYDWDMQLDDVFTRKASQWFTELDELPTLKIARCLQFSESVESTVLHIFVDASNDAYGAVIYIRHLHRDSNISVQLVAAKSRVAPLNAISIPRLELMAAITGLRLALSVSSALEIDKDHLIFWSDSANVLWWIRGRSRNFKPFVAHRVGEIQSSSNPAQWKHIPTKLNPADHITRGLTIKDFQCNSLWWNGPAFLKEDLSKWPVSDIAMEKPLCSETREQQQTYLTNKLLNKNIHKNFGLQNMNKDEDWRLQPERFSSWTRLTRIYAWIYRFLNNCRLPKNKRTNEALSAEEIHDAEMLIIQNVQKNAFPEEYSAITKEKPLPINSKLLKLNPKLDSDRVLRCDGRLQYAEQLSFDAKFPIILPRKNWVTKLIVKHHHELGRHICGTNQTLSALSARFWIMCGREEIREWENECAACKRQRAKAANQIMAPLPEIRLKLPLHAFSRTAVDYAGPFTTIIGRGRRQKRYLCLFTCLTSRAVHLEMAYGMDTDSFLNAFYRMVNRRGFPKEVLSDNGGNFVGANRELKELLLALDKDKIQNSIANQGIKWHFIPPLAPHFGGVHETMIKAAKKAIYAILGSADVTDEELMTAFTGAEALINSRPLTYQTANVNDNIPLTPNHFLFGQVGGLFAPESVDELEYSPRKRWRRVQELVRHFWHRWMREWLPGLNSRQKWQRENSDLKVGTIVLVISSDSPRGHWPLGRVLDIYPGRDGHVRVVKIKVGHNILTRPINKLCPVEFDI